MTSRAGRALGHNALTLVFAGLWLLTMAGQSLAGWRELVDRQLGQGLVPTGYWRYVASSDFAVDITENWQSEFLQFFLYIYLTVWLVQRGSSESKSPGEEGLQSDEEQLVGDSAQPDSPGPVKAGGWRTHLYSHSLGIVMGSLFLLFWAVQSVSGWVAFNEQRLEETRSPVTWGDYLLMPDFWSRSLQNWQSEFLAVAAMVVAGVWLRERGSPESKQVGAPHEESGSQV